MADVLRLPVLRLRELAGHLRGYAYRYSDEVQLHGTLENILLQAGEKDFVREHAIDRKNRFDFWFPNEGLVIEVKVDGTLSEALRQIDRYTALPGVRGVLLASTPRWANIELSSLHGIPVHGVHLQRQCL
ncbi:MAG: hypothetical protein ACREPQ_00865 [Rhodanobacter sp.]